MRAEDARADDSVRNLVGTANQLGMSFSRRLYDFVYSHRWTWVSFAAHGVMLLCFSLMPPQSSALAVDLLRDDNRLARYLAAPVEQSLEDRKLVEEFLQGEQSGGQAHEGVEGEAGKPTAEKRVRRMGGGAPKPAVDMRSEAEAAGILGVLAARTALAGGNGRFDMGEGYGYEPSEALGKLFGAELGDASGFGSFGMKGTGRRGGGGVVGSIEVGRLGTGQGMGPGDYGRGHGAMLAGKKSHVPRILSDGAEVRGSLSKETIRRVIQRHLSEVRFCYEEALRRRPELAGRVQVLFLIAPSGAVQSAKVIDSSLASSEAEGCIVSAVTRWAFPAPDGGGMVTVRYPFLLQQAGE